MNLDTERIERRLNRLTEIRREKAQIANVNNVDGSALDMARLLREERQLIEELAVLRSRTN
jgi:hypothetical protein